MVTKYIFNSIEVKSVEIATIFSVPFCPVTFSKGPSIRKRSYFHPLTEKILIFTCPQLHHVHVHRYVIYECTQMQFHIFQVISEIKSNANTIDSVSLQ